MDTKTDARNRQALRDSLPDTTKLIIAQRISSIEDADRVLVLDGGRVDAIGTPTELLATNQIYREVYSSQQGRAEQEDFAQGVAAFSLETDQDTTTTIGYSSAKKEGVAYAIE